MDGTRWSCNICGKKFSRKWNYSRHVKSHVKDKRFTCQICSHEFTREDTLQNHQRKHFVGFKRPRLAFQCQHCDQEFNDYTTLFNHVAAHHPLRPQVGGNVSNSQSAHRTSDESALDRVANKRFIFPNSNDKYDLITFFTDVRQDIEIHLQQRYHDLKQIKWYTNVKVQLVRESNDGEKESTESHFRSVTHTMLTDNKLQLKHQINEAFQKQFKSLDEFIRRGSGWSLDHVENMEVYTSQYKPIDASSHFQLPAVIQRSRAVLNIMNVDDKCFLWCILASLHPAEQSPERIDHYESFENELDMTGIDYPVAIDKLHQFEKQNNHISVNVLGYEENEFFPLYVSPRKPSYCHEVDLLYLKRGRDSHYVLIKSLSRLLYHAKTKHHLHHFCRYCLQSFQSVKKMSKHVDVCCRHGLQKTSLPEPDKNDKLEFKDFHKGLRVPFTVYADFECIVRNKDTCAGDPDTSSTTSVAQFEACGYGYQVVCIDKRYTSPPVIYRGENASQHFLKALIEEEKRIKDILRHVTPIVMSPQDEEHFANTMHCHICSRAKRGKKCRDHCHVTGQYRGPACQDCNLNYQSPAHIPVFMHNLSNFDMHLLCDAVGLFKSKKISCIPNNMEKYISFSLGNLRFLDSYRFISSSLETMVSDLAQEGVSPFKLFTREFNDENTVDLLLRKGVYPYNYMDSFHKFEEKTLPPREAFYNNLTRSHLSQEDYAHAQEVWKHLSINNLGEYHDLYLKTDVLLLADCFERFRDTCMKHYKLDPCHFYTIPGLSWAAALRMTGCSIDLLTDPDQYLFFERGVRGGMSVVSQRHAKANNPYIPETYNPSEPNNYLLYLDANNLYGKALSEPLPTGDFRFLSPTETKEFDVNAVKEGGNKGYVLEVDLDYDETIHDLHNDYPVAPEKRCIPDDILSPFARDLWIKQHPTLQRDSEADYGPLGRSKVPKLIASLENKRHYVVHYRNLQLYLSLGLKLKAVHQVMEFTQSPWLKEYIVFNTEMRKKSKTKFEKNFFKLLINSIYGKSIQSSRNYRNIHLVHTQQKMRKLTAMSSFEGFRIFNENLVGVELKKTNLLLDKPIFVGMSVLELSKVIMYNYHYGHIKQTYGDEAKLLYTDTDSFIYQVFCKDWYADMLRDKELYDLSNYPKDHAPYDESNHLRPGVMKDECPGTFMREFVGLRSKMYSIDFGISTQQRAKGIQRTAVKQQLKHEHYKSCLFDGSTKMCDMEMIRSEKHQLGVNHVVKRALTFFDDKRFSVDTTRTLAYGHYLIM